MPPALLIVHYAAHITSQLDQSDLTQWTSDICAWQTSSAAGLLHATFGKDGPNLDSRYGVRHVHVVPDPEDDAAAYRQWQAQYQRGDMQTSDGYMIYTLSPPEPEGRGYGLLVIDFFFHPGAHAIWDQPELKNMQLSWDKTADMFRTLGKNIA